MKSFFLQIMLCLTVTSHADSSPAYIKNVKVFESLERSGCNQRASQIRQKLFNISNKLYFGSQDVLIYHKSMGWRSPITRPKPGGNSPPQCGITIQIKNEDLVFKSTRSQLFSSLNECRFLQKKNEAVLENIVSTVVLKAFSRSCYVETFKIERLN